MPDELDQMSSSVEGYGAIVHRRRWWILIIVFLTWSAVWGISWILPSTYQSDALILLEQQNVSNQYVVPNVNASVQDHLQSISQQVLSRTRLQAIIDRFHLYPPPHGLAILLESGDPIEKMRRDISIELVQAPGHPGEYTAFKMRYIARSPELAQKVNSELTAPFVKENVQTQQQLSEDPTSFLEQRQQGEQFRILDPPSLPKKHIGPNRFKFSLEGLALGMVLGFGIGALLELSDIRIRREKDLKALVPSSVLVRIPRLSTQREEAARTISWWLDFSALTIVITLIAFGNFYAYIKS